MDKPPIPISFSPSGPSGGGAGAGARQKKKLPTPRELVEHYESQGVEKEEASLKVIDDLQNALYRVVTSGGRGKKDKFMSDTSRKLDAVGARLSVLEYKLDSKPSYPQAFAVGVASGAALSGLGSLLPIVFGGLNQVWTAVQSTTKTSP